jgi:putative spermidine/putrescine transport system substrate-binding protein
MDEARAKQMPSHPDNAQYQLTLKTDWYSKWRTIAAEMYTDMMTE